MDTMINAFDLPFPVSKLPSGFNNFVSLLNNDLKVKDQFPVPEKISLPYEFEAGHIPALAELGVDPKELPAFSPTGAIFPRRRNTGSFISVERIYGNSLSKQISPIHRPSHSTDTRLSDRLFAGTVFLSLTFIEALKSRPISGCYKRTQS